MLRNKKVKICVACWPFLFATILVLGLLRGCLDIMSFPSQMSSCCLASIYFYYYFTVSGSRSTSKAYDHSGSKVSRNFVVNLLLKSVHLM